MSTLAPEEIGHLLLPFLPAPSTTLLSRLAVYLELLVRWNARTNLTAIRDPEEIVLRHFGESVFAAQRLGSPQSLLDFGSGAGFPGIPIALLRPEMRVTLAESQHKKASFLREAVRVLELDAIVWTARVEDMPAARRFDCVALRAVDGMARAGIEAERRAAETLVFLSTVDSPEVSAERHGFSPATLVPLPGSVSRVVAVYSRL